jgi:flavodoxin
MSKRSLIIYSSWGGNTEKVALRFKEVFERKAWQCDLLKVTKHTDIRNPPVRLDDYDLICVGSLVISGLPTREIYDDHHGILVPSSLIRGRVARDGEFASITSDYNFKKGIIFVTYTGGRRGPPESAAALAMLELRLEDMRVKVIGKFACPGGHGKASGQTKSEIITGVTPEEADREITEYFGEKGKIDTGPEEGRETSGNRDWHWNVNSRPNERDLTKAEIFLEEILEDYYAGGVEAAALAQYVCIA